MTQELMKLLNENFEYNTTNLHTAFPGVVKSYDSETRRAEIQPSLKRKLSTGEFIEFPVLVDVPVLYFGTVKGGIHITLEENDEVLVICSERCLDMWKDNGLSGIEDSDRRRFTLSDAICIPGLQATTFPQISDFESLALHHDSNIVITNEKSNISIQDDLITINNDKSTITIQGEVITFDNGKNKFELNDTVDLESTGSGTLKIGNSTATLGKILSDFIDTVSGMTTVGSPATHTVNPSDIAKLTQLKSLVSQVFDS